MTLLSPIRALSYFYRRRGLSECRAEVPTRLLRALQLATRCSTVAAASGIFVWSLAKKARQLQRKSSAQRYCTDLDAAAVHLSSSALAVVAADAATSFSHLHTLCR